MRQIKISFLGDMMCEPLLLKAAARSGGMYDFSGVFCHVRSLLADSDFVIGNLETPLAGEENGYTSRLLSFNTPDSFALAAKEAGIDLLLTANNHCLDRGVEGLKRTLRVLDEYGIPHAGSFSEPGERGNTYLNIGGLRVAVIAYTYGTNYSDNRILLSEDERGLVNLLRPQTEAYFIPPAVRRTFGQRVLRKLLKSFPVEKRFYIRKWLGLPVNEAHPDDNLKPELLEPYLETLFKDIDEAKKNADLVLFCPHMGGQFNLLPGAFSRYIASAAAERGVDAIVASHAHVVQEVERMGGIPCFYSLGNFSMSPNSIYLLHENLPDYGIAAHLYLDGASVAGCAFSVLRIVEEEELTVYPADEYAAVCGERERKKLEQDVRQICRTLCGEEPTEGPIRREYRLW